MYRLNLYFFELLDYEVPSWMNHAAFPCIQLTFMPCLEMFPPPQYTSILCGLFQVDSCICTKGQEMIGYWK